MNGIKELLKSKKGTLCLLILASSVAALMFGKLPGVAFAAVVGTIGSIYCFTQHKVDIEKLKGGSDVA